uniref:Secreted protein n=1 Tax=Heterorhabditis bacteriophora TaxID=37862 RepID=A0A1I7WMP8_HETBA
MGGLHQLRSFLLFRRDDVSLRAARLADRSSHFGRRGNRRKPDNSVSRGSRGKHRDCTGYWCINRTRLP